MTSSLHTDGFPTALRIVHVDTGRLWRGGQRQALLLARELRERGHACLCAFQAGSPLACEAAAAGLDVLPFRCRGEWDLPAAISLRRLVGARHPHLMHAHDGHAATMALLAGTGLAPVVASRRAAFAPRRNPVNRLKLRAVRRWLAISEAADRGLARAGVDPDRIDLVPSGVRIPASDPLPDRQTVPTLRPSLGIPVDSFVVLTAGRLEPLKGQRTFVEACAFAGDLGNTRWVVAGEGPDRPFLEQLARSLGVADRVVFAGNVGELPSHLHECQVFVLASFREGLGSVLLEAMAAGLPVVATGGRGTGEIFEDGTEGRLVPAGDARSVAEAVRVLYLDPDRRRELGARARGRAGAFSLDATVERTLASYRTALGRTGPPRAASPAADPRAAPDSPAGTPPGSTAYKPGTRHAFADAGKPAWCSS